MVSEVLPVRNQRGGIGKDEALAKTVHWQDEALAKTRHLAKTAHLANAMHCAIRVAGKPDRILVNRAKKTLPTRIGMEPACTYSLKRETMKSARSHGVGFIISLFAHSFLNRSRRYGEHSASRHIQ